MCERNKDIEMEKEREVEREKRKLTLKKYCIQQNIVRKIGIVEGLRRTLLSAKLTPTSRIIKISKNINL